jgi:hypothetical protein
MKPMVGKFQSKRLLVKPKRRREDDIKMDLIEIRRRRVDWNQPVQ